MNLRDTIAAISTPPGRGGIGIVRISGELSRHISDQILRLRAALTPRVATVADLMEEDGETVDEVVATFFAASKSFTGEDVLEISCHGSPVILGHCLTRAMTCGARLAEPGEFTLRAFVNGRIDLPRAEAVRDLIESTTLYQARVAAQQAQGSVSRMLTPIKADLLELIALLEAGIDFAEDDISVAPTTEILRRIDPVIERTEALAASFRYGNLVRNGFSLAIVGSPNVGKSSLFNRLLQRDRAIVTAIAGTTRDLVSETAEFDGIPIRLVDTAGIRETTETIERLGIEKSYEAMADADLTILVLDGTQQVQHDLRERAHLTIANKADLPGFLLPEGCIAVSALTGQGIDELRTAIHRAMAPESGADLQGGFITTLRHHTLLNETVAMLRKAREAAAAPLPHELLLLDLYCALQPLDAITGATTADDILNRIFSSFCIGK